GEVRADDAQCIQLGGAWTLREGGGQAPWAGRGSGAGHGCRQGRDVRIVRWRPEARREGPGVDRASLVAVCAAIIRAAGAPVPLDVLTRVVGRRFNVGDPPLLALVDAVDLADLQEQY